MALPEVREVLAEVDWRGLILNLVDEHGPKGTKNLTRLLRPTAQEEAAKKAIELFLAAFLAELDDTSFEFAMDGYRDLLGGFVELAAPFIVCWLQPETTKVDLHLVREMWTSPRYPPLPDEFRWDLVETNFERAIRKHVKKTPELREQLLAALAEEQTELQKRIAGPDLGFNLGGYRQFLRGKCGTMSLAVLHKTAYHRQLELWSVFVPQNARESVPAPSLPREVWKQLENEGRIGKEISEEQYQELCRTYRESPAGPVGEVLDRHRLVVIAGDPGSGKSSLLKQCLYEWVKQPDDEKPTPLWMELREFAEANRHEALDLLGYLSSERSGFALDANQLHERLQAGKAVLHIDGLDEVFDIGLRASVIEQIAGLAARYGTAKIVVTTRVIGYEPERLRNAGFAHATLEDFDETQVRKFVERWHEIAEPDVKERQRLQTRMHAAIERSPAVCSLTGNPLLLTMMAILNRNQDLPRDRVELYREASRVLLHDWDAGRALGADFDREEKEELLRRLATRMQDTPGGLEGNVVASEDLKQLFRDYLAEVKYADPREGARKLLAQLTERNFILCAAGGDRFAFVHRTFLEFYCADGWNKRLRRDLKLEPLKELFAERWTDARWHEVLRLLAGMVEENHAGKLIEVLLAQDGEYDEEANVLLAGECLGEIRNRSEVSAVEANVRTALLEKFVYTDPRYSDTFSFADWLQEGIRLYVSLWHAEANAWLRELITDATVNVISRQLAVLELARGWHDDPATLPWLQVCASSHASEYVRGTALREVARGWKDNPATLSLLQDRARSDGSGFVEHVATEELENRWKDDPDVQRFLDHLASERLAKLG
ncbi:MAG: NACHT domain-containing protein [Acidobacteria bacterium]|nr:NACHT domain-containing protein [Acidobacteriota bacterium]